MREAPLPQAGTSFLQRYRWIRWFAAAALLAMAVLAASLAFLARRVEPYLHARIVEALEQHFHARVELDSFHVSLRTGEQGEWGVWARGAGLRIWPPAQMADLTVPASSQPLIQLDSFSFQAPLRYARGAPIRLNQVRLRGLRIRIPRRTHTEPASPATSAPAAVGPANPQRIRFKVQSVECAGARLEIETTKLPLVFDIAHVLVDGFAPGGAIHFAADLTNPRPHGAIHATGIFGPWQVSDPGETPLQGDYTLTRADLGDFKGIAGLLSSTGHFQGALRRVEVQGSTNTPDFRLEPFNTQLPLRTSFRARVDGTTGDTWLDAVDATLGSSHLTAKGQIVRVLDATPTGPQRGKGHDIALDVDIDHGHIEDFLRLLSHAGTSLLIGNLQLQAHVHVPPGPLPVHQRMDLQGQFLLDQAEFTSATVQQRIRELSLRGQGRPHEAHAASAPDVHSQMQSHFTLATGEITLPDLTYNVPGAQIQLHGAYTLDGGALDFIGAAHTQATLSQMVGGWKGLLLKPADPFFKHGTAGAVIPIRIGGTRQSPDFGIDINGLKTTSPERPGDATPKPPPAP